MKLLSVDLEMNQPSGKIIQIGAAVGDTENKTIGNTFSVFVNPEEPLSDYIIGLTGIKQKDVDNGLTLEAAYSLLVSFAKINETFVNPLVWGGDDMNYLRDQLPKPINNWPFGRRIIDAKTVFVTYRISSGDKLQGGLARSMTKLGLAFEGRKHDAKDDALNTLRIYFELLERFA